MTTTAQNSDEFWTTIHQQTNESIILAKNQQWHALPDLLKQRQHLLENYFSQDVPEQIKNNVIEHLREIMEQNKQLEEISKQQNLAMYSNIKKFLHNKKSLKAYQSVSKRNS